MTKRLDYNQIAPAGVKAIGGVYGYVMQSGLPKALINLTYLRVSQINGCAYCIASHSAAAKKQGMTPEMLGELMAIVGMANETNSLANGYRVPVDERFEKLF